MIRDLQAYTTLLAASIRFHVNASSELRSSEHRTVPYHYGRLEGEVIRCGCIWILQFASRIGQNTVDNSTLPLNRENSRQFCGLIQIRKLRQFA
jgi:hypothetical protein